MRTDRPMYHALQPDKIVKTLEQLEARIAQRFPKAGLGKVCAELTAVARASEARARSIARPAYLLRGGTLAAILTGLGMIAYVGTLLVQDKKVGDDLYATIQGVEATFNIAVLTGAAIFFLVRIEERMKRAQALAALNELRSIVHVIDMHQLTKDPMMLDGPRTSASPERTMTAFELTRYLDYCSEMLSLSAKIAALYAQSTSDSVVIEAASDLSTLTTNLSSKIWQKITIVQASGRGRIGPTAMV
jgi:hypothetical protein